MGTYFILDRDDLTTTPELIIEAAPVDRVAHFQEYGSTNSEIRFTETGDPFALNYANRPSDLVIPAGVEVWASALPGAGPSKVQVLVTGIGR